MTQSNQIQATEKELQEQINAAAKLEAESQAAKAPTPPKEMAGRISQDDWNRALKELDEMEDGDVRVIDLSGDASKDQAELDPNYSFCLVYKPKGNSRLYKGHDVLFGIFGGKVPTIGESNQIKVYQVQLRGGLSPESFDDYDNVMFEAQAYVHLLLTVKPEWFKPNGYDHSIILRVYMEMQKCERRFRGQDL